MRRFFGFIAGIVALLSVNRGSAAEPHPLDGLGERAGERLGVGFEAEPAGGEAGGGRQGDGHDRRPTRRDSEPPPWMALNTLAWAMAAICGADERMAAPTVSASPGCMLNVW